MITYKRGISRAEVLAGKMHGDETPTASRVEGDALAMQVVEIGDTIGHDCRASACGRILRLVIHVPEGNLFVI